MKHIILYLFFLFPSISGADCQKLSDYLSKNFPLRTLVERFAQEYTYAVIEQHQNNTNLSVITCIDGDYAIKKKVTFHATWVDRLRYDFKEQRLYVVFKDSTEQYGWVYKEGDKYDFEYFFDPDL